MGIIKKSKIIERYRAALYKKARLNIKDNDHQTLHVDNWLDDVELPSPKNIPIIYAKFAVEYMRMPAWKISLYEQLMSKYKLFCTYEGKRYRVVMASRLGTIGLNPDFNADHGAVVHAYPGKCTDWDSVP